jgi:DNA anti-recombination protein RmuC
LVHIEIINQIIDAEKNARKIAEEAKERLARLDTDLSAEYEAMRASYLERAERRLESVVKTENEYADEIIVKLDAELASSIKASEESAAKNSEIWAEKLFEKVIDFPELHGRP